MTRGVGYLLAGGALPRKVRTHHLGDDAIAVLAKMAETTRA